MVLVGRPIGRAILMPTFIAQPPCPSASLWMKYYGRLFYWKANLTQTFPPPLRPSQGNGYSLSGKMVLALNLMMQASTRWVQASDILFEKIFEKVSIKLAPPSLQKKTAIIFQQ